MERIEAANEDEEDMEGDEGRGEVKGGERGVGGDGT